MTQSQPSGRSGFLGADPGALQDNVTYLEWCDGARRILHASSLELGMFAAEAEARFRTVSRGLVVAGMTSRYRARQVASPVAKAAEAIASATLYVITSRNRYEAVFTPELEAAGWKGRGGGRSAHQFRAQ